MEDGRRPGGARLICGPPIGQHQDQHRQMVSGGAVEEGHRHMLMDAFPSSHAPPPLMVHA